MEMAIAFGFFFALVAVWVIIPDTAKKKGPAATVPAYVSQVKVA